MRNGAAVVLDAFVSSGFDLCLSNPGTSEMHLVEALAQTKMRSVLGLFESVCTGAADGYARMSGKPALSLLHLGPGLANGLANIHNARRGRIPSVTLVGDHARALLPLDPPLSSDIGAIARGVGGCHVQLHDPATLYRDVIEASAMAVADPSTPIIFSLPADCAWLPDQSSRVAVKAPDAHLDMGRLEYVAGQLRSAGQSGALLLGGQLLDEVSLSAAAAISTACGTKVMCETFAARHPRGAGRIMIERMAYFPRDVLAQLTGTEMMFLVGASRPTAFFAYPDAPLDLIPTNCACESLTGLLASDKAGLIALAELLRIDALPIQPLSLLVSDPGDKPLDANSFAKLIANWLPSDAIVVDESITFMPALYSATVRAARHDWLSLPGGALGYSMPVAIGAAIACPDRQVVCIVGDGAAHYAVQALWTMARESLSVVVIVLANRAYRILEMEFDNMVGRQGLDPASALLTTLDSPQITWTDIARGYGVPGSSVKDAGSLRRCLAACSTTAGPAVIEVELP